VRCRELSFRLLSGAGNPALADPFLRTTRCGRLRSAPADCGVTIWYVVTPYSAKEVIIVKFVRADT
jgi:hypothetical protein